MDCQIRNLERQHQANPDDIETAQQLIRAYKRKSSNGEAGDEKKLSKETIEMALHECSLMDIESIEYHEGKQWKHWEILFGEYVEINLQTFNKLAWLLNIDPEQMSLNASYEDKTQCSCGMCGRDIQACLMLEITV